MKQSRTPGVRRPAKLAAMWDGPADVIILPAGDAMETIASVKEPVTTTILDPWYNRGVGGVREDYIPWLQQVIGASFEISQHVFVWGFPEIVGHVLAKLPHGTELVAWLTWYYKNCPSVIRGWRSAQYACLHLARRGAKLYPEHFLNDVQKDKFKDGKMRYIPGPPSVIEAPLIIGFVGKNEQTGHPAQKPLATIKPLIEMTTKEGDLVLDPFCGSGTTGAAALMLKRRAILGDASEEYAALTQRRIAAMRTMQEDEREPRKPSQLSLVSEVPL